MSAAPRFDSVQCLSPAGLHRMAYVEWGDPHNPRVLICAHGLTRMGRDFDRLGRALAEHYRVVCPDVVGRGRSDWLREPMHYSVPQYVADMVTLIARINAQSVHYVGTSMGGLIGISLAGLADSPVSRLVINDVGPRLDAAALVRIGSYVGKPVRFAGLEQAWREITEPSLRRDGGEWVLHYDPLIAMPFGAVTPQAAAAGEAAMWKLYDAIGCPTLITRGAESDLLSRETAAEMSRRGPRARVVEFAGVGHAPMFFHEDQISVVREFLLQE
jgi:pimeloyl-ACP methyl ester carboxylesterase